MKSNNMRAFLTFILFFLFVFYLIYMSNTSTPIEGYENNGK